MKKKIVLPIISVSFLTILLTCSGCSGSTTITYSLYPYLVDEEYYRSIIEEEWKKAKPNIELKFVEYNCFYDGEPKDIDVVMYDSTLENEFVEKKYIQSIDIKDINQKDDFFEYTINDLYKDEKLYGIPAILCESLIIYDENNEIANKATCIEDLSSLETKMVANVDYHYQYFYNDYLADKSGIYKPCMEPVDDGKKALQFFRDMCNPKYLNSDSYTLPNAYVNNECDVFCSFTETLSLVGEKIKTTKFKTVSMTENPDIPLLFADVVGLNSSVKEDKRSLCIELMNLISSVEVIKKAAIKNDVPSYLIYPRKSFYVDVGEKFPVYKALGDIVSNPKSHIFR